MPFHGLLEDMKRSLSPSWTVLAVLGFLLPLVAPDAVWASAPLTEVWNDLSIEDRVSLGQELVLRGLRGEEIRIGRDENFILDEIIPLTGISVVDYFFTQKNCANADLESEMEIVLPNGNSPSSKAEVGVIFHKGCRLEIYVESKDLFRPSFFRK